MRRVLRRLGNIYVIMEPASRFARYHFPDAFTRAFARPALAGCHKLSQHPGIFGNQGDNRLAFDDVLRSIPNAVPVCKAKSCKGRQTLWLAGTFEVLLSGREHRHRKTIAPGTKAVLNQLEQGQSLLIIPQRPDHRTN